VALGCYGVVDRTLREGKPVLSAGVPFDSVGLATCFQTRLEFRDVGGWGSLVGLGAGKVALTWQFGRNDVWGVGLVSRHIGAVDRGDAAQTVRK